MTLYPNLPQSFSMKKQFRKGFLVEILRPLGKKGIARNTMQIFADIITDFNFHGEGSFPPEGEKKVQRNLPPRWRWMLVLKVQRFL